MTISPSDLFEIAFIVPNLEEAMIHFHRAFGYTFSPIVEGVLPMRDDTGDSTPPLRMAVSLESPQLELIETRAGTCLVPPAGTGLHHLGFYVDDLAGESERLGALGFPFDRAGLSGDTSPAGWLYHEMPDGTLIELVDRATAPLRRAMMEGKRPDSTMVHRMVPVPEEVAGAGSG